TTLGRLAAGARVNLEKSLVLSAPLGGHLVSGHVDGVGTVAAYRPASRSVELRIAVPGELARYVARKGSICVDGVSLTVNVVDGCEFEVSVVPHTLQATTLADLEAGTTVNIEVDLIARYLERLMVR
ncbi:MAG: riboflavin synthase, partial [Aquabacterium sp.]|uniref:riboflavin synthase n=1 Tax=Aquabacterium sp. TaxID=1872578 RepID=UPI003BB21B99